MNWLTRLIPSIGKSSSKSKKSKIPDGVWTSCPSCESALYQPELQKTLYVVIKTAAFWYFGYIVISEVSAKILYTKMTHLPPFVYRNFKHGY